jgi:hypothetical protein
VNLLFNYGKIGEPLIPATTIPNGFKNELVLHRVLKLKSPAYSRAFQNLVPEII